ncbi:S-adenosyl-L-methionine-dependent methyltransferase [Plenodomus tracheiphilus IPT5]|uniref:S-adenosyl-L-methionine-dependent methyltransferase n=1 Tax=Plenodomus tracheiphilus IPT5 TaxID=1408161 RepID=A0A6A7BGW7_9PLEO|nr:S-adenosyl-L-methionine-dependent methyltransferase [Plenodomus tracheiphilus IPT5]
MASNTEPVIPPEAQSSEDTRFQTNNTMSSKPQPKQQLSKAMEHMRFAVTVDPIPHAASPPPSSLPSQSQSESQSQAQPLPENDAYGVPSTILPLRQPPSRSHDPTNNQKRADPFTFGSRYLEANDNIFEFNAWDHVTVDPTYAAFSATQYAAQRAAPVNDFDRKRYMDMPEKWWNQFYKNNKSNFFKNRKWLSQEFPILGEVGAENGPEAVVLEVGAGAGNSAFPILQNSRNPRLKIHACDFSKKAVELIRGNELYDERYIQADVWDVASPPDTENNGLPPGLTEGSVDVVLMIFIFSALSPQQWDQAIRNIWRVLKPGGQVLFRDYGRGDLAQVRFKKGRYLEENFYVRGDGTRVYFFEQQELEEIWGRKPRRDRDLQEGYVADGGADAVATPHNQQQSNNNDTQAHNTDTDTETSQQDTIPTTTSISPPPNQISLHPPSTPTSPHDISPAPPRPTFEIAHIGVDRRMLVNRQRRLKMYRCWMQAVFRKAGGESSVPTSTLRVEKEGGKEGEGEGEGGEGEGEGNEE